MSRRLTQFRPRVHTRHPSHENLRPSNKRLPLLPVRSVVRLGSTTDKPDSVSNGGNRIEVNTVQAVQNCENKETMKRLFTHRNIPTPRWTGLSSVHLRNFNFPMVIKKKYGSRGRGIYLVNDQEELDQKLSELNPSHYIVEEYINYPREYRIHVTRDGCLYTCRKMLRQNAENRWYRNQENCVWYLESNPSFKKPRNWDQIVSSCIHALEATGLDIGACDVRVSRNPGRDEDQDHKILEINSAPRFGEITEEKYMEKIPDIIRQKAGV